MAIPIGYTKVGTIAYTDKGTYDAYATYNKYNVVQYQYSSWVCQQDGVTGVTPSEGAVWHLVAKGWNFTFDEVPTANSQNLVRSGGIYAANKALADAKQDKFINASILAQIPGITNQVINSSFLVTSGGVKEALENLPGGGGGSYVKITTTETSLYGKRVRITQGTDFYEMDFDSTGVAEFEGIIFTGDVIISSTDGTDTASKVFNIPYFGNYEVGLQFFVAHIHAVTSYAIFNGQTVKIIKDNTVVGTGLFAPSSTQGQYEATIDVSDTGTYKATCKYGWRDFESENVVVTSQTTYNTTIPGFVATVNLSTTTDEFKNLPIVVTLEGYPEATGTINFSNGSAVYTALKEGNYKFTVTYDNVDYEFNLTISSQTTYSLALNMWTATIAISAEGSNASRLYNRTITIKKNDVSIGTTSFNNSGVASFKVHETGTYTIECTDADGYVYRDTVAVSAETTYNAALTVYTLNISTTSSDLFGGLITVSKNGTSVGTVYFSSGAGGTATATFYVDSTGTYTASVTYSGDTYEDTQTVSSAQTPTPFIIDTIPDGSTVTPIDDIQTWLNCAGIRDKTSYTTLSDVLADHDTLYRLMASDNAVDYLVRSTTWVSGITADEYAMKYIGKWNYASDTLLDDSTWRAAICNSTYFESVLNTKVPTMTNNTTPSGTAFNSQNSSDAYYVFDGKAATRKSGTGSSGGYMGYTFGGNVKVCKAHIKNYVGVSGTSYTYTSKFQRSNNGTWTDISDAWSDALTDSTNKEKIVIATDITADSSFRLFGTRNVPNNNGTVLATEIQFYGRTDVTENVIDIYSAASDTISITGNDVSLVVETDPTGHGTIAKSSLPNGTYTFASTVAKDPDNLSNDYSKNVTITDTSVVDGVYVMPDNTLYWYGYKTDKIEQCNTANGWTSSYSGSVTWNAYYIELSTTANSTFAGVALSNLITTEQHLYCIVEGVTATNYEGTSYAQQVNVVASKNTTFVSELGRIGQTSGAVKVTCDVTSAVGKYVLVFSWSATRKSKVYALFTD